MKASHLYLGLGFFSVIILILCLRANPAFLLFQNNYYDVVVKPSRSEAEVFKDLPSSCQATAQYRYDAQRTGAAPADFNPSAQVKIIKKIAPLNVDIHGASKSSPTVDDTGVYVGSDTGWFFKMDHDGHVLWKFYVPGSNNGIHGSAAVDDKKVYIGTYNGFMYALDKTTGELVWANPVGDYIGASPLLADGGLFIAAETSHPNGLLVRMDCNTGQTLWVSDWLAGHPHSSPAYNPTTNSVLVGANSGRFFAFDAKTGQEQWRAQLGGPLKGTAMVWDGTAYFASWDKNYYGYDIRTGKKRWESFMGGRIQTNLSLVADSQLGITNTKLGEIVAINLNDGTLAWRLKHGDSNHQFSILITKDPKRKGESLAWSRCKTYQLCTLDAKTGKLLHHIDLPGAFTSVPFAWKNRIYISLDKNQGLVILE